jgi:peroxiredoxin
MRVRSPHVIPLAMALGLSVAAPLAAQQQIAGFGPRPVYDLVVPPISDAELTRLVATLDSLLAVKKEPTAWMADATYTLWDFARHLQAARLTPAQEARVLRHLDVIARAHPQSPGIVDRARHMVTSLTVGKTAPDIVGTDLDGVRFKLSDYRGKVVLLVFSGEWCGICRSQYPYERLLLELYKGWPFEILGVESGNDAATAKKSNDEQGLLFRAWWNGEARADGTIASTWNVVGWPAAYLLDAQGVIRFVDLRDENLLKGVRQLLLEQQQASGTQKTPK